MSLLFFSVRIIQKTVQMSQSLQPKIITE